MTTPIISQVFEHGLVRPRTHQDAVIREHIQATAHRLSLDSKSRAHIPSRSPGDFLTEVGDYFTQTAVFWSALTDNIVESPRVRSVIHTISTEAHETSAAERCLGDLDAVTAIDVKSERLRTMAKLTQQYSEEMQRIWHSDSRVDPSQLSSYHCAANFDQSRLPRLGHAARQESLEEDTDMDDNLEIKQESSQPQTSPHSGSPYDSDGSSDDEDLLRGVDMDALKQRGKGVYYCPKGERCDKGGVDADGNLVQFDRNSSFAQHCNKHRKPWRCDLPGCPNPPKKRKFARRDGLERHKQTVKHHVST